MGRTRGFLWLLAGLIVAMLAGVVGFMTLSGAAAQRSGAGGGAPDAPVVVAAQAVPVRSLIKPSDVVVRNVPVSSIPEGALRDSNEAIGKVNLAELYPGEILLRQRLADPNVKSGDGRVALALADDQVLIAYPAGDLLSRSGILKPGDRVDLLFSVRVDPNRVLAVAGARPGVVSGAGGGGEKEVSTFNALQNVTLSAVVGAVPAGDKTQSGLPQMLLLTVSPQDALVLKYLKDIDGTFDMALRAPGSERPLEADPVDIDYIIRRYRLQSGAKK
jgi:pilus assembly protein CpaB